MSAGCGEYGEGGSGRCVEVMARWVESGASKEECAGWRARRGGWRRAVGSGADRTACADMFADIVRFQKLTSVDETMAPFSSAPAVGPARLRPTT